VTQGWLRHDELGLTPDTRWQTDAHTLVEAAHRAGFTTVGIHSGFVHAQAPSAFVERGVGCHELGGASRRRGATMNVQWVSTTFAAPLTDDRC
jgi:hypothetical protein